MIKDSFWIRPIDDFGETCPIYVRDFACDKPIKCATLQITAMGMYEATINGSRVGEFIFAPGCTVYDKRHLYQTYDITSMLSEANTIEVIVGKGWYRGRFGLNLTANKWGAYSCIIAELKIEYTDGSVDIIKTDKNWKAKKSNILSDDIYNGEVVDARITSTELLDTVIQRSNRDVLIPSDGEEVHEHEHIKPIAVFTTPAGEKVLDFGQNLTGYVQFEIDASDGDVLSYSHAEVLDAEGNFYTDNLRKAKQQIHYTCRDGKQTYKPKFTFMGFRYIRIDKEPSAGVSLDNFTAIAVHSNIKRTGYFSCSNDKINKLYQNIIWGQKDNFVDIPTDCPQRDERLGWTGDAQVFIKAASYNFNVDRFFKKWLRDLKAEQHADGCVPIVIPDLCEWDHSSSAWGDAATICPMQLYLTYGDKDVLVEQIDSMIAWVEYIRSRGDNEFLWTGSDFHFGDWLGLDGPKGTCDGASRKEFVASAYYAYSTQIVADALKAIDRPYQKYEDLHNKIVKAFREHFPTYTTQTECALALYFNLTPDKTVTAEQLAKMVKDNGMAISTGFVGTPYIMYALSENGYVDIAYSLLLREAYPSWLFSVNMGATTIWEHWDGINEKGEMWSDEMNSFNHYAYGAVASWMYDTILGIRPLKPGFEQVLIAPVTDSRLQHAEGSLDTRYGKIVSEWKYKGDKVLYHIETPVDTIFKVGDQEQKLSRGTYKISLPC